MTKKDYVIIAQVFDSARIGCDAETVERIALTMSNVFELDNPRFNRRTFLIACGFKSIPSTVELGEN